MWQFWSQQREYEINEEQWQHIKELHKFSKVSGERIQTAAEATDPAATMRGHACATVPTTIWMRQ